jgi:hypothetical protein
MAWFDPNWIYRTKITIDSTKVDASLTDFPIFFDLADIGTGHGFWSNVKSDGADIRITKSDGTSEVAREVTGIDTGAETGEVHFSADGTLSSSSDTDYYVYYGNAIASDHAASATYGMYNVWDSNYKGIYHLSEATAEEVASGTSHQVNEGSPASSATSVTGKVGKGFDFNNSTNTIVFEAGVSTHLSPTTALQFELWFNADTIGSDVLLYCRGNSTTVGYGFWFWNSNLRAQIGSTGWTNLTYALSSLSVNTWYHIVGNWNGTTYKLYLDGTEVNTGAYAGSQTYSGAQMTIGTRASGDDFDGTIDELRISDIARSADWISTQYNNQSSPSTFYTIGAEEQDGAGSSFTPKTMFF